MSRRALGKGLGALLGDAASSSATPMPAPVKEVLENRLGDREAVLVTLSALRMNPHQPRKSMDEEGLRELAASIEQNGILQPVLVRRKGQGFELVAGERRVRAARLAGLSEVPALVCTLEDAESMKVALLENIQRENLNAMEEAEAYRSIMEAYGATHQELATMLGKNRSTVTNTLRLLQLEASIQALVVEGTLSMGHARALLGVDDSAKRLSLARRVEREGWSVRTLEHAIQGSPEKVKNKTTTTPKADPEARALREFEGRVSHRVGAPCTIRRRGEKGVLQIEFFSNEELERVLESMGVSSQL